MAVGIPAWSIGNHPPNHGFTVRHLLCIRCPRHHLHRSRCTVYVKRVSRFFQALGSSSRHFVTAFPTVEWASRGCGQIDEENHPPDVGRPAAPSQQRSMDTCSCPVQEHTWCHGALFGTAAVRSPTTRPGASSSPVVCTGVAATSRRSRETPRSDQERLEARYNRTARALPVLEVGTRVAVQDSQSKLWDRYGTIVDIGRHRNYFVRMNSGRVLVRNRRALRRRYAVVPTPLTQPGTDLRVEQADHDMAEEMAEEPRPPQPLRRSRRTRRPRDRLIEHDDI